MNEELKDNLEMQEEESVPVEAEPVKTEMNISETENIEQQPEETEAMESVTEENIQAEPLVKIESEQQPEAVLEQAEDGSWRHTEDSPFSPFYVPDRKEKKNNGITIALVAVLLILLVGGMIFAVSKLVEAAMGEATTAWNEGVGAVEGFFAGLEDELQEKEKEDFLEGLEEYDEYEEYDDSEYDEGMYEPSEEDDYYVELADAIRYDLSYSVDFEEYEVYEEDYNVDIWVQYVELSGDNPYIDQINEQLKDGAMYYAKQFNSLEASDLSITAISYVTYMDEEKLSVVVDERYFIEDYVQVDLYCMNFDLTTGTLLYNTEIVEVSDDLVEAFRKQSDYQNGESSMVSGYSDEEIAEFMKDEEALILYYSPVGLEIGYNNSEGWISATLKEYQKYLKKI